MSSLLPRRRFLACAAGAVAGVAAQENAPERGPDLAVVNAVVYTVDERRPRAEALAVKNGRIIAVGSSAEIAALATPRQRTIDAAGMTVVPGFIDAHCHPA